MAAISGCLSNIKRDHKVSKVNRLIDNGIDNAQDKIEDLKGDLDTTLASLAKDEVSASVVIDKLVDIKNSIEEHEEIIKVLQWAKKYINEEIEVEDEKK